MKRGNRLNKRPFKKLKKIFKLKEKEIYMIMLDWVRVESSLCFVDLN